MRPGQLLTFHSAILHNSPADMWRFWGTDVSTVILGATLVTSAAAQLRKTSSADCIAVAAVDAVATAGTGTVSLSCNPANTNHSHTTCTAPAQRPRRWSSIVQLLLKCFVFTAYLRNYHILLSVFVLFIVVFNLLLLFCCCCCCCCCCCSWCFWCCCCYFCCGYPHTLVIIIACIYACSSFVRSIRIMPALPYSIVCLYSS